MKKSIQIKALALLMLFLTQLFYPTVSLALTGGPSQPGVESFEPVSTDQMVDPFTGDFNYNLPLLTVPGPGGGYPINIAYHAGVSMDEEASWVGLGWNINPGVINRALRGIPDDFDGEEIKEITHFKPLNSFSIYGDISHVGGFETLGAESPDVGAVPDQANSTIPISSSLSATIKIDNYRGVGLETNFGMNYMLALANSPSTEYDGNISHEDTDKGTKTTFTFNILEEALQSFYTVGFNYSSQGTQADYNQGLNIQKTYKKTEYKTQWGAGGPISKTFDTRTKTYDKGNFSWNIIQSSQPAHQVWSTKSARFTGTFGIQDVFYQKDKFNLGVVSTNSKLKDDYEVNNGPLQRDGKRPAFGYFYADHASRGEDCLNDFYFDNNIPFSKKTPRINTPVATHDIYLMSGQGLDGMFRSQKNGIGLFSENTVISNSYTVNVNPEYATLLGSHYGTTVAASYGRARIGSVTGNSSESLNKLKFGKSTFKLIGAFNGYASFVDTPTLGYNIDVPSTNVENSIADQMVQLPRPGFVFPTNFINTLASVQIKSSSTSTNIEYFTHNEKIQNTISNNGLCIANQNTGTLTPIEYIDDSGQLAEFKIRKTDGQIYVYGLPALNKIQVEKSFSVDPAPSSGAVLTSYQPDDASVSNEKGNSNFYYEKEVPQYAHSYLITQILSSDFVDRTGDGPTPEDLGSYVKFSYTRFEDVIWRIPYTGANYSPGNLSDPQDDRASYINGKKDIYFLNSVETKTHIARFYISPRSDGRFSSEDELNSINDSNFGANNYKLDRIELYQKSFNGEPDILLQTVVFEYDYSSCIGVPNYSEISDESSIINGGHLGGKLTLRKISFSYGEKAIVKEMPYEFEYYQNPSLNHYNIKDINKWNSPFIHYSSDVYEIQLNPFSNPYLHEYSEETRNTYASLFNLKSIKYPSGTKITINYEEDDYGYVQDKAAMNMLKIVGISDVNSTDPIPLNQCKLRNDNRRIYFILDSEINSIDDGITAVNNSIAGLKNVYFKLFLKLKSSPQGIAEDYITCFAELNGNVGFIANSNSPNFGYGYVDINKIESTADALGFLPQALRNPLRYSGVEYLQNSRPELTNVLNYQDVDTDMPIGYILSLFTTAATSLTGFSAAAVIGGYCNEFSTHHPSFIRLNDSDHRKFGGGHRVSSIETSNSRTFSETSLENQNYITRYFYNLEDGSSSGVAVNEPNMGGEESALYQPLFFGSNKYLSILREKYIEERAMQSFYPSASVGYSRVISFQSALSESDDRSNLGITEHKFFTAKDYPVKEIIQAHPDSKRISVVLPLVVVGGSIAFKNFSASQKFKVILNDMHGKPSSSSSYSFPEDETDFKRIVLTNPNTQIKYEYYEDNRVKVLLDQAGTIQSRQMGINVDGYFGEKQHSSWDISAGGDANVDEFMAGFVPSFYPELGYGEQFSRFLSSTTTIHRNAILKSQTTISNGIQTKTENKLFDPNTGRVLVTETTVNGKDPITSFSIPAYWNYPILGAAGQNYRYTIKDGDAIHTDEGLVEIDLSISGGSVHCSAEAYDFSEHYTEGDVVKLESNGSNGYYWVKNVSAVSLQLIDNENTPPSNTTAIHKLMVMQSGFRNQQDFDSGSITISGKFEDLFVNSVLNLLNTELMSIPLSDFVSTPDIIIPVSTCSKLINFTFDPALTDGSIKDFRISTAPPSETDGSEFSAVIDPSSSNLVGAYIQILRTIDGEFVLQVMDVSGNPIANLTSSPFFLSALNFRSLDKVINASAIEFSEDIPLYSNNEFISTTSGNPYLNGTKGQWRPIKTYSYQGNRVYEQNNPTSAVNGTNAHQDGLLFCFPSFVWSGANTQSFNESNNWLMSNEITIYNPNGLALEERNALGIYASQLVTNNENLVLCSNSNARMNEIGCLSFEESSSSSGNPGHINLLVPFASNTNYSHTGKKSHKIYAGTTDLLRLEGASSTTNSEFRALGTSKYQSHFWVKFDESISVPSFNFVDASGNLITQCEITNLGKPIDGWYLVSAILNVPSTGAILKVVSPGQTTLFDDFRIQPLNSSMVTYVYDYQNYRLLAQLDNQNYATFYNYSLDGSLIQIKQETASGVYTVSSMNQNIKR